MEHALKGKVAVVTGAAKGIGASIAEHLAAEGACVAVNYASDKARAEAVVKRITDKGGKAVAIQADVTRPDDIKRLFAQAEAAYGTLDVLVNNAGMYAFAPLDAITVEHFRKHFDLNVLGLLLVTQEAVKHMGPSGGSIINISSIAGLRGYYPGFASMSVSYSAAKAGIVGFTRQVAAEYAKEKIRVNAIAPGWHGGTALGAERRAASTPEDIRIFEEAIHARIAMKHRGVPDDLIGLVVYLASDASHYVTGQVIAHDGGWDAVVA